MQVEDVVDRESLRVYLNGLEGEDASLIPRRLAFVSTFRYAFQILHSLAQQSDEDYDQETPLHIWGGLLILGIVSSRPTPHIKQEAANEVDKRLFAATVFAGFEGNFVAYMDHIAYAEKAIVEELDTPSFWGVLRAILNAPLEPLVSENIWKSAVPDADRRSWELTRKSFKADAIGHWNFWIKWFDRVLAGQDFHADRLAAIFNELDDEDWLGDPAALNKRFDEVLALYEAEDVDAVANATPIGETVDFVEETQTFTLVPLDGIKATFLADIHGQIDSALRLIDLDGVGGNAYGALRNDLAILEDARTLHRDRPVLIVKDVSRVLKRLARKIEKKECPSASEDENIEDLQDILTDVQVELVGFNEEVKAYHRASHPPVDDANKHVFVNGANALLPASDGPLSDALNGAVLVLQDEDSDGDAKRDEQYRIIGLLVRARKSLKQSADFVKDASIVVGGVTAVGGPVAWLISPAFREFVEAAMKVMLP